MQVCIFEESKLFGSLLQILFGGLQDFEAVESECGVLGGRKRSIKLLLVYVSGSDDLKKIYYVK